MLSLVIWCSVRLYTFGMAVVRLSPSAFVAGELPGVCAVTGAPTVDKARFIVRLSTKGWWRLRVAVAAQSGYPVPVARSENEPQGRLIAGWLPVSAAAAAKHSRDRLVSVAVTAVGLAGVLVTVMSYEENPLITLLTVLAAGFAIVGAALLWRTFRAWPWVRLGTSGRGISVVHVHPLFAAAVASSPHHGQTSTT